MNFSVIQMRKMLVKFGLDNPGCSDYTFQVDEGSAIHGQFSTLIVDHDEKTVTLR